MKLKVLVLSMAVSAAFAQGPMRQGRMGPRDAQPKLDEVKAVLNLTEGQITQIRAAQKQVMDTTRDVRTQMFEKGKALRDLRANGPADAAAVGKLTQEIETLRNRMLAARTEAHEAALKLLTTEQRTKLAELEEAAKLRGAIQQAHALGLLEPPEGAGEGWLGMRGRGGPGLGPGPMGPEVRGRRPGPNR